MEGESSNPTSGRRINTHYRLVMCDYSGKAWGLEVGAHLIYKVKACKIQAEDGLGLTVRQGPCAGRQGRRKGGVSPGRARDEGAGTREEETGGAETGQEALSVACSGGPAPAPAPAPSCQVVSGPQL